MDDGRPDQNPDSEPTAPPAARRPYVAPCIEQTGDFERLVLTCSRQIVKKENGCFKGSLSS